MNIKDKINNAVTLVNEVFEEMSQIEQTEYNQKIMGLFRSFGKDHFLVNLEIMQLWINNLEIEKDK